MHNETLKNLKVLLVEDEDIIREKTSSSLEYIVKEVVSASNGAEALDILKEFTPDLIITDLEMPILNGIDLIKKVRNNDKDICIIVLTAHTNEKYLIELIDMHIEKYIIKPINFDKIIEALKDTAKSIEKSKDISQVLPKGYEYNWNAKELIHNNTPIKLTKKEVLFLELLLKNNNNVTSYEQLQEEVWQENEMTENALRSMVRNLRKKLPKDFISNLSGMGYKIG